MIQFPGLYRYQKFNLFLMNHHFEEMDSEEFDLSPRKPINVHQRNEDIIESLLFDFKSHPHGAHLPFTFNKR